MSLCDDQQQHLFLHADLCARNCKISEKHLSLTHFFPSLCSFISVGTPIPVPLEPSPTRDQVAKLKEVYLEKLNQLFQKYKPIYDPDADDVEFF
ncbi:hypothetical protein FGIG_07726 [Fasciola gigantica]|uniref:Uncharacterized protein n=1 Tax=Fasciola gigantica TaxID=46835 RepID=A0A504Z0A8_FASGI|nr:hypothetical protein FGIG_07726 [Fasciola gigantica]